jgi:hypothetical protein
MVKSTPKLTKNVPAKASKALAKNVGKAAPVSALAPLKEQILAELGKYHFLKKYSAKTIMVAKACGFSSIETKRFRNAKGELKKEGKITSTKDMMELTAKVIDELTKQNKGSTNNKAPKSNKEHQTMIKTLFEADKNTHTNVCKLIDLLADGDSLSPKEAARAMGYAATDSKGFRNAKKLLKEGGFLGGTTSAISLTDEMFPFGRP